MKVLLTGASGFVGSHILDALRARQLPAAVLLRPSSERKFLQHHLPGLEIRTGSIQDPESLGPALAGITHVVHCAGCTKARRNSDFFEVNQVGTRNVVSAINSRKEAIQRLVHISSLAVTGPAPRSKPAREDDPFKPISEYGKSKWAAEIEVREKCLVPFTILRPPAVYGPRDNGFFPMFQAIRRHILPRPSATQYLSLVFGPDLAQVVAKCVDHPAAAGKTYFAACEETVTARQMAEEIASRMGAWTVPWPLPPALLWPVCLGEELISRATGRPMLLNLQKYAELRAPGWVCDPSRIKHEVGCECPTRLTQGVGSALDWYKENGWLR